ncbi:hypothetical protein Bbelb_190370 [Branchiostoma belcheri]|nr:hypothetical protein Bbelb_190370 [Branchiostoma belcheri]
MKNTAATKQPDLILQQQQHVLKIAISKTATGWRGADGGERPVLQTGAGVTSPHCARSGELNSITGGNRSYKPPGCAVPGITTPRRNTPATQARGAAAAGYITPNDLLHLTLNIYS